VATRLIIPRFVHWSAVSTLSNSFAARATILIPLVGYLILFNEKMADYLNLIGVLNSGDHYYGSPSDCSAFTWAFASWRRRRFDRKI
jgi:hypothetical protein